MKLNSTNTILNNEVTISNLSGSNFCRRAIERLDFLLLLIESLEINGLNSMLSNNKLLENTIDMPSPVELWKKRAHNPLRKASRRGALTSGEVESLIFLVSTSADRLYPLLRQLLSSKEPDIVTSQRWKALNDRFCELVNERMNLRRVAIKKLFIVDENYSFLRELVLLLAFSTGSEGMVRLKNSLNDIS
ncbi:DUF3038 domain-containing protein [Prochlorococcus sp. MIT 1223]|uniref:DUF3038 domain-containing protein n=1 Tax=Prochlorococcus sp. MIT 1223 TaxID=3096217 RepID=UPI002A74B064|nr:DUF3038 domain-containing protein [Prochlorococcus sp. MIT 1223]